MKLFSLLFIVCYLSIERVVWLNSLYSSEYPYGGYGSYESINTVLFLILLSLVSFEIYMSKDSMVRSFVWFGIVMAAISYVYIVIHMSFDSLLSYDRSVLKNISFVTVYCSIFFIVTLGVSVIYRYKKHAYEVIDAGIHSFLIIIYMLSFSVVMGFLIYITKNILNTIGSGDYLIQFFITLFLINFPLICIIIGVIMFVNRIRSSWV